MGEKNRDIAEYYKKRSRGEQDDKLLDRIVGGGKRERTAKAEERKAKREYRDARGRTYTVVPGDSWFSIAGSELGDQRYAGELARANPGFDVLNPGAVLRLPPLDENETPVLTYGDQETLEGIQEKLEAAKQEAVEQTASVDAEIDPLEVSEERKQGFAEMGETGAYGLEEEYEYEAEAQALAQALLEAGFVPPQWADENAVTLPPTEESEGTPKMAALDQDEFLQGETPPPTPENAHESPEAIKDWETIRGMDGEGANELNVLADSTATPTQTVHIVEDNEFLSTIAEQYGVSIEAIVEENNIQDPNKINVGQELVIPSPLVTASPISVAEVPNIPQPNYVDDQVWLETLRTNEKREAFIDLVENYVEIDFWNNLSPESREIAAQAIMAFDPLKGPTETIEGFNVIDQQSGDTILMSAITLYWLDNYQGPNAWWKEDGNVNQNQIAAFILDREANVLWNIDMEKQEKKYPPLYLMARIINEDLKDGLDPQKLARYTAFYNIDGSYRNGYSQLGPSDWEYWMNSAIQPGINALSIIENINESPGNVTHWWRENEIRCNKENVQYEYKYTLEPGDSTENDNEFYFGSQAQFDHHCIAGGQ